MFNTTLPKTNPIAGFAHVPGQVPPPSYPIQHLLTRFYSSSPAPFLPSYANLSELFPIINRNIQHASNEKRDVTIEISSEKITVSAASGSQKQNVTLAQVAQEVTDSYNSNPGITPEMRELFSPEKIGELSFKIAYPQKNIQIENALYGKGSNKSVDAFINDFKNWLRIVCNVQEENLSQCVNIFMQAAVSGNIRQLTVPH